MSDCSNHKKEVAGISDMKELAKMIGDLHYSTLFDFMEELQCKLIRDANKDEDGGRFKLSEVLWDAAAYIGQGKMEIKEAWEISKPFMKNENNKQ